MFCGFEMLQCNKKIKIHSIKNKHLFFFMIYFNQVIKNKNIQDLFKEICKKSLGIRFLRKKLYFDIKNQMLRVSKSWNRKNKIELHHRLMFLKYMI